MQFQSPSPNCPVLPIIACQIVKYYLKLSDLLSKVDPAKFQEAFGADLSQAQTLIEAKTLTITKLMNIMPQGTIDPSPFLYNNTMYTMAALVGIGAALHFMVRPVDKKYFEKSE